MSQRKQNNMVGVIKFSSHKFPEFKETQNNDWINFGQNNDYPAYLLKLYNRSAKHNAIINGKAAYIFGKGWEAEKSEEQAQVEEFLKNANVNETLNQVSFKAILDLELFGGMAIEIIWSMGGGKAEYRHIDFSNVRSNKDNTQFYFTKNWFKKYTLDEGGESNRPNARPDLEEDWTIYEMYNPLVRTGKQLLYFKQYRPGLDVYPLPEYLGCIPWIEIDFEVANFHYNNVKNGFTATHLLKFYNGVPQPEEQKKIEEAIKSKFAGTDNAGRFVTTYSDGKDKSSEVETLTMSDIDKQFDIIGKTTQQEIFSGHNITSPILFGIKTEGQLGGRSEIIEANELFQNTYINKKQQLVELVFNELAKLNGITVGIKLTHLEPIGVDWGGSKFWEILTMDEKREKAGLKPLPKEIAPVEPVIQKQQFAQIDFSKYGRDKKDVKILHKWDLEGIDFDDFGTAHDLSFNSAKEYFASPSINATDRAILDLLIKDPLMPSEQIAEAINLSVKKVELALSKLENEGLIEVTKEKIKSDDFKTTIQVSRTPTAEATKIVDARPPKTYNIEVLYSYEWRSGFSDADIDTSRDFCKTLLSANRLYTRDEIETISSRVGMDVWVRKGGWYHDSKLDVNVPYCRHIWVQNLITTEA